MDIHFFSLKKENSNLREIEYLFELRIMPFSFCVDCYVPFAKIAMFLLRRLLCSFCKDCYVPFA